MAHFIDEDWVMHKRIINFRLIDSHKGDDIGSDLMECIRGWGIKNVIIMTFDNASSNDKVVYYVLSKLDNKYQDGKWNSTYEMLKRVVDLRNIFFKYEEDDPNYERELSRDPGARAPEKFKDTTESVSASTKPLAHLLLDIDTHLRQWACDVEYCYMVSSMRTKFDKYWGKLDELNDYMYFAVLLDPTMKKDFYETLF
ncbi:zinc finger BED domain-containing protein RICESLEEPER 1-like [Rutidosis leptorrhynchoides]|uniref:zinc finger BED domain-containing protein RICESLEEPER 1-like n=1 Tax=Rutidosis leptorrhynchoides TaxID=125765 RepID=UPI003A9A4F2F